MDLGLQDRVVVVTGGSSGIGLAAARQFLLEGARVAICARDESRLATAAARLRDETDGTVLGVKCDVTDCGQVENFRKRVVSVLGQVDCLIENAGRSIMTTFEETSDDQWLEELRLKFLSVIYPTKVFLPELSQAESPSIVVVNSLLARRPEPQLVCTSAARAGVLNLVKSLSWELAPQNIRVNSVLLGLILTAQWERRFEQRTESEMSRDAWLAELARKRAIPLGRVGMPEEVGDTIVFLASPRASYITGATVEISGGQSRFA